VAARSLVLALAVAAFIVLRRRRRRCRLRTVAFRALDARHQLRRPEAVRRFYWPFRVVRAYVEALRAQRRPHHREIRASVGEVTALPPEPSAELVRFLLDTDLVKFAAHRPDKPEITNAYERALGFVETTRQREAAGEQA
jgi:hypothetical protein